MKRTKNERISLHREEVIEVWKLASSPLVGHQKYTSDERGVRFV
jgi:hypothetical protein